MNTYRISLPLLALLAMPCRADIFVFDGTTLQTTFQQLPNEPEGQLLDSVVPLCSVGPGFCILTIAPLDSGFSIKNPDFNFLPIETNTQPPVINALLVLESRNTMACAPTPCYIANLGLGEFPTLPGAVVETGKLQLAPFNVVWSNGTATYTDTFEFQVNIAGVPPLLGVPEPSLAFIITGIGFAFLGIAKIYTAVA